VFEVIYDPSNGYQLNGLGKQSTDAHIRVDVLSSELDAEFYYHMEGVTFE
jgi:hypothetical protein